MKMRLLPVIAAAAWLLMVCACASIGRPDGGPRDETPPAYTASDPVPGQLNFAGRRITVSFNENITLDDPNNKIVISPPQRTPARIGSGGRRVFIELADTLMPSTTYTVDFADAVRDLNEGNVLDGFAIDFSTGPTLDSLRISGMLLEARTLEPAQGMMVGVYADSAFSADTTLTTLPLERITKTNQLGQFTIRNLRPVPYRVFAVNDLNRDYHWDPSEDIAFAGAPVVPTAETVTVADTLAGAPGRPDSIAMRTATRYRPDDLLLTWYNEAPAPRYLVKNERPERRRLEMVFSAPADSLPQLAAADGTPLPQRVVMEASAGRDTVGIWLPDTLLCAPDTLRLLSRYQFTDSLQRMAWRTDTLTFALRGQKKKNQRKRNADADTASQHTPMVFADLKALGGNTQELNAPLLIEAGTPVAAVDSAGVHLEYLADTLWTPLPPPRLLMPDALQPRRLRLDGDAARWTPSRRYRLSIDSAAVTDIFGNHNKALAHEFATRAADDYCALFLAVTGIPDSTAAVAELLSGDEPKRTAAADPGGKVSFTHLMPGTYYVRLYIDSDTSSTWTPGSVTQGRQPEEVYYLPKKITLKKNWDVELAWDLDDTPVDLQKPQEIKKNKPKLRPGERPAEADGDDGGDDGDPLFDTMAQDPFFQNPAVRNNNNNNNNNNYRR